MPNYSVTSASAEALLYAGNFPSLSVCLHRAIGDGISLAGADLSQANLLNAELDGGDFTGAIFTGANLTGANLGECLFSRADFTNAVLHGASLCDSDLTRTCFDGTLFGGTDITGATLRQCLFSTLSAFSLAFPDAGIFADCRFANPCGTICPLSRPPVVVQGLGRPVIVMDHHLKIGADIFTLDPSIPLQNLRLRLEQMLLALMMDDKRAKIA